jgi:uncharacterized membrane protein YbaN (DUF454 family)
MSREVSPSRVRVPGKVARSFYIACGLALLALAIIGAFLPVMPTTIFVILAAWCFARSSPRLEAWLLRHQTFGPALIAWRREGAIRRRGKIMALLGMALGLALFWLGAHPGMELLLMVIAAMLASAWYVVSRPEPSPQNEPPP